MLTAAFVIFTIAVALGAVLAVLHLRTNRTTTPPLLPQWPLAALHGILALIGLGCLALALRGPPRGVEQGTASFGMIAAVLFVLTALLGAKTPRRAPLQETDRRRNDRHPRHARRERLRYSRGVCVRGIIAAGTGNVLNRWSKPQAPNPAPSPRTTSLAFECQVGSPYRRSLTATSETGPPGSTS